MEHEITLNLPSFYAEKAITVALASTVTNGFQRGCAATVLADEIWFFTGMA